MTYTIDEVKDHFRQAVERSIRDAERVPGRSTDPLENAKAVYEGGFKEALHESVLEEWN